MHLHDKSSEVCIKARSPTASLPFKGKVTEQATVKWSIFVSMANGIPKLRTDGKQGYYAQIQGQLTLSGLPWCDVLIYLSGSRSLNVEHISFDPTY